jgi:hypothetical protein
MFKANRFVKYWQKFIENLWNQITDISTACWTPLWHLDCEAENLKLSFKRREKMLKASGIGKTVAVLSVPIFFIFISSLIELTPKQVLGSPPTAAITLDDAASNDAGPTLPPSKEAGTPAGPSRSLPSPDPDAFRALYGYQGPYYRADLSGRNVVVLSQTVYQWPVTDWKVSGLIRNETGGHVKVTAVTARLFDSGGNVLGNAAAWLPLNQLRPGEPAPFVITTAVPGTSVSSIDWHIDYTPSGPSNRLFQIVPYWQLPFGDRQRHTGYPFDDPSKPPYPYVVFGSFRNDSTETVDAARLLGAWLDDQRRVIYVDWLSFLPLSDPNHVPKESISLSPGRAEDYIYQNADPAVADRLATATLVLWEISR